MNFAWHLMRVREHTSWNTLIETLQSCSMTSENDQNLLIQILEEEKKCLTKMCKYSFYKKYYKDEDVSPDKLNIYSFLDLSDNYIQIEINYRKNFKL